MFTPRIPRNRPIAWLALGIVLGSMIVVSVGVLIGGAR